MGEARFQSRRLQIAVAHPHMGRGGSEAACLWAIEALKDQYDVTLLTTGRVDWEALNAYYGSSIQPGEVAVSRPRIAAALGDLPVAALRGALHQRHCRSVARDFDVLLSAYNPCDFGRPAIHRIADFAWDGEVRARYDTMPDQARRLIHRDTPLRKAYLALAGALKKPSGRDVFAGEDVIIANSRWTAGIVREKHPRARIEIVYPPVPGQAQPAPWAEREAGFVCLGRIAHEKRIETIIEILSRVRAHGHDVHLHVIGPLDGSPYAKMIERLCVETGGWAVAEGSKAGADKEELIGRHRFAIHARKSEAFGIAVAEMVRAGCVTFVPDDGATPEIVSDGRLCYADVDDAVRKIDAVLRSEALAAELHGKMLARGRLFGVEAYQRGIRRLVEDMLRAGRPQVEGE